MLIFCRAIEEYFGFPEPNELVKKARIPGGMYTNMVAQLKQLGQLDLLESNVVDPPGAYGCRFAAFGNADKPIIGAQAVSCALDQLKGRPMYSNPSNQFVAR